VAGGTHAAQQRMSFVDAWKLHDRCLSIGIAPRMKLVSWKSSTNSARSKR
jgi:hypothetical protein